MALRILTILMVGLTLSGQALASVADKIQIDDPYVRIVPPMAPATAAFMVIRNTDQQDHALISAKAYINDKTELHTHIHDRGVMRMRQVPKILLPASQSTALQPGGLHIMLIGLNHMIRDRQPIKIDLTFEDGSTKTITALGRPLMPMQGQAKHTMKGAMDPLALMKHANPALPNLMGVAVKNADMLGLNSQQIRALKAWGKQNGSKMKQILFRVRHLEKEALEMALAGAPQSKVMVTFEQTLQLRKKIAMGKLACRDNLRKILTPEQYEELVEIYPID